ncbi:MAG: hypothetical protein ABI637_10475, partial [Gemmatimonadota bacterium]
TLLEARLDDPDAAERWAAELGRLTPPPDGAALASHLTRAARAQVAWSRSDPATALAELEAGQSEAWFQLTVASPFYSQACERFLRADLLVALGRTEEAAGWYQSMAERSPYEIIYRAPAKARIRAMRRSVRG